eukprot:397341-Rhodomonas_salina.3
MLDLEEVFKCCTGYSPKGQDILKYCSVTRDQLLSRGSDRKREFVDQQLRPNAGYQAWFDLSRVDAAFIHHEQKKTFSCLRGLLGEELILLASGAEAQAATGPTRGKQLRHSGVRVAEGVQHRRDGEDAAIKGIRHVICWRDVCNGATIVFSQVVYACLQHGTGQKCLRIPGSTYKAAFADG